LTIVAIDGPAGAGKSTVADLVAADLRLPALHTGLIYRAVAALALDHVVNPDNASECVALIRRHDITLSPTGVVLVDHEDHTDKLYSPEVADAASRVSLASAVRDELRDMQRTFARERGGVIAEGRDTGEAVFPEADVKIWLDAAPAIRRDRVLKARGQISADLVVERDRREESRPDQPVRPAPGSVVLDSSYLSVDEVVGVIRLLVSLRGRAGSEKGSA
jgi:cytidylate kinase